MIRRAIVVGNSITLRTWQQRPTQATVIATNRSWAWVDADVICATQPILPDQDCAIHTTTAWTSSGVWGTSWAVSQGFDEIWLLAMEGMLVDQMVKRSVISSDLSGNRGTSQHWTQDWRYFLLTQPRALNLLRPVITRQQHRDFADWSGWQQHDVQEHAPQLHIDQVVADTLE
jgi:hypothetical protein